MEMEGLLWIAGIRRFDYICNQDMRQRFDNQLQPEGARQAAKRTLKATMADSIHADLKLAGPGARQGKVASNDHQSGPRYQT
ncbi:hypothetical protein ANCDUO_02738 [Ancylostoma duodenale]|uniref:Uncharacterized protein n=1 Tax=Ancylostoma duodenale TaxID=51022 RepID=A0A0C2DB26_9BILA|nr:hypothetical protein ANCDUO_02738 [Ancylostoma duodenale]